MSYSTRGCEHSSRINHCTQPRTLLDAVRAACPVPDPCASDVEWLRFHHRDVANLTPMELRAELPCVFLRLKAERPGTPDCAWLRNRAAHLSRELGRRRVQETEGRTDARIALR